MGSKRGRGRGAAVAAPASSRTFVEYSSGDEGPANIRSDIMPDDGTGNAQGDHGVPGYDSDDEEDGNAADDDDDDEDEEGQEDDGIENNALSTNYPLKGKGKAANATVVRLAETDSEEEDDDDKEAIKQQLDADSTKATGEKKKRGRPSKAAKAEEETEPSNDAQQILQKRRGRPTKEATEQARHSSRKHKTLDQGTRRSSRVAAENASLQITEQSLPKKATKPSSPATPTTGSRRGRKRAASKNVQEEYEVDQIVKSRLNKKARTTDYLVKWVGYPSSANTWEPAANLTHCAKKIAQFEKSK